MAFKLRPYQKQAIQSVIEARKNGIRRMLLCLPTGAGKTVVFSHLAKLAKQPVLVLAHRRELILQAQEKLSRALPEGSLVAIEQANERAPVGAKAVVASIRTLRTERLLDLRKRYQFGLIIYDECHHAAAEDNLRVLTELGCFDADWQGTLLGVTATTTRGDGQGLDSVFEQIVFSLSLSEMINDGYLVKLRGFRIATAADLHQVSSHKNDFVVEELADAVDIESRNALVARSIQDLARDRRTIAFCVTVNHARNLARALRHIGVSAAVIHGGLKKQDRADILRKFHEGRFQVITNVAVLTEGFDDPAVSCIAMARPTRSDGLYAQCVGRGTRLFEGKTDCLILDFVDLSQLSLVTLPSLFGMPQDLQLDGDDVVEASEQMQQLYIDFPGFEVEPGEITLDEIKRRAESFNPITLEIHSEVLAVSANAWVSLGKAGLALHAIMKGREPEEILIKSGKGRGKRYGVYIRGKLQERFSHIEDAVEAVDYEVAKRGSKCQKSARKHALWRREEVPAQLLAELGELKCRKRPRNWGDAWQLFSYLRHQPAPKKGQAQKRQKLKKSSKAMKL